MRKTFLIAAVALATLFGGALSASALPTVVNANGFNNVLGLNAQDVIEMQKRVDTELAGAPGGTQVSQYEVTWKNGGVVVALPAPGHRFAPPSSPAVLAGDASAVNMPATATTAEKQAAAVMGLGVSVIPLGSSSTCPYSAFTKWYCWYTDSTFDGARFQFKDYYCNTVGTANKFINFADYGRDNQASSWVNNTGWQIRVWDGAGTTGTHLWTEGTVSNSPHVGSLNNDKASSAMTC